MQYAILGRTGLKVSRLGFGAMRLPMSGDRVERDKAIPMLHRAFELGVTYVDSAVGYCHGDSQRVLGEALKGWRDKIVVSTKNPHYDKADDRPWWKNLEDSLRLLDVERIDVYSFHSMNWRLFEEHIRGRDGQLSWMQKARDQGLIGRIGFSFHDKAEALVKIAETGEFDVVTLQYNLIDPSNEPALPACRKAGLGVVVMGPVGGGRLGAPSEALRKLIPGAGSVPEVALRFVLANPNVTVAISGMSEMAHVEENTRVAARTSPLSPAENRGVQAALRRYRKLADLYCTGCNYCMPCPRGVDISSNFMVLNYVRVYDLPQAAKERYRWIDGKGSLCVACGSCMSKCPQHIDIISQLRQTVRTLDDAYGKLVVTITPTKVTKLSGRDGRFDASIRCKLQCHNLSDKDVSPKLRFSPGRNLTIEAPRQLGTLGPFARRALNVELKAKAMKAGQAFQLGTDVEGAGETIFSPETLRLAIAPKASRRSSAAALRKAPHVRAEEVSRDTKPSAKALASNSLKARFAYDDEALIVEMQAAGSFRPSGGGGSSSRRPGQVWLSLAGETAGASSWRRGLYVSFDISGRTSAPVPVRVRSRRRASQADKIRCELSGGKKRRRLLARIPWKVLKIARPKPGKRLVANFGIVCAGRGGPWQLRWRDSHHGGGGCLILAE